MLGEETISLLTPDVKWRVWCAGCQGWQHHNSNQQFTKKYYCILNLVSALFSRSVFFHLKCECGGWSTHLDTELRPFPVFIRIGTVSHPIISHRVSLPYLGGLHTVHTHHNTTSDSGDLHPLYHYTPMSLQPTASSGASPPPPPHTSRDLHHHTTHS